MAEWVERGQGGGAGSSSLRQKAYNHVHSRILSGELPNGHQVSELSLAKAIGISRTPVREAIQQLQQEGLLEQIPRLGTIVRTPQRHDIVELFELREALEPFAAGLAAKRASLADFPALEKLCAQMDGIGEELRGSGMATLDPSRLQRFLGADMAFHVRLLRASRNRRIVRIVADSRVLLRIFSARRQEHDEAVLGETYQFHRQILDAVKAGDAEAATASMTAHIHASMRQTLEHHDRVHAEAGGGSTLGLPDHLIEEFDKVTRELGIES